MTTETTIDCYSLSGPIHSLLFNKPLNYSDSSTKDRERQQIAHIYTNVATSMIAHALRNAGHEFFTDDLSLIVEGEVSDEIISVSKQAIDALLLDELGAVPSWDISMEVSEDA